MTTLRSLSIRKKLMLLFTITASVTVMIACAILWVYQLVNYRITLQAEESAMAQLVAESSAPALLFNDAQAASETLAMLRSDARIETACLYDKHGSIVAHFSATNMQSYYCPPVAPQQMHFTGRHLFIFRPIKMENEAVGNLYFDVSLTDMYRLLLHFGEIGVCVLLMTTIFAFVLASFLERIVSGPIIHLTRIATEVSEGNYLLRAESFSDDEAGVLINQFNDMMDGIQRREADLQHAHDTLEEKVKTRTLSLRTEITERKAIERDLETAKLAAEEANRAKSAFLANMSHELRTPLNAIIGYSEMLYEDAQAAGEPSTLEDLNKVLYSAHHLLTLISDVLDFSKIEAGQMKVHLELVPASSLLNDVLSTAEILAKQNHNQLRVTRPMWEGLLLVDPMRFRQCLLNLLSNSCKFTDNGTITITVATKREDGMDWILWSVSDTGIGVSEEGRAKLFQIFSQVDSSTTRKHGGSGLGLAISQQLCQAMNSHITVESDLGVGSTFTIHIPAYAGPADGHVDPDKDFERTTKALLF